MAADDELVVVDSLTPRAVASDMLLLLLLPTATVLRTTRRRTVHVREHCVTENGSHLQAVGVCDL